MASQSASSLPDDYLKRVYAGVLGKLIGVYLGRPIEGRPYSFIKERYGYVKYYLHEETSTELVAADDDVSGTFAFIRALEEHGADPDISAKAIGDTWLNSSIEFKCPFWWGGRGFSTEHTAFLNLARGIHAPQSGSIETNGTTIAEQIGGQIFIDGWAMVAPANPALAAKLADAAASVSHDGEAKYAAKLWAVMESEAFISKDVEHLLDTGLQFVPSNSLLAKVVGDVRQWAKEEKEWEVVRQKIEDIYGYDKFQGACHVIPNHAIMIMALIYGGHSFHEALCIINTAGWDTDCNSGNIGALLGIMHGLSGIDQGGPDWRGPLEDRAIISSALGDYTVNNATRVAYDIANLGRKLAGNLPLEQPKDGHQFHFSLPGGVQGFRSPLRTIEPHVVRVEQAEDEEYGPGLAVRLGRMTNVTKPIEVLTPTFVQPEPRYKIQNYEFIGSPLIYPGQRLKAKIRAAPSNGVTVVVALRLKFYGPNPTPQAKQLYEANPDLEKLFPLDGPSAQLQPGVSETLEWMIPDEMDHQPIAGVGIVISCPDGQLDGTVWLDSLGWSGAPKMSLTKPKKAVTNPIQAWRSAWIDNGDAAAWYMAPSFSLSKDKAEGTIICGSRTWIDYAVKVSQFSMLVGSHGGVMIRNQGLRRYYGFMFTSGGRVTFIRALDDTRTELASAKFSWGLDKKYEIDIVVRGKGLSASIDGREILKVEDGRFDCGGIGLVVVDGAVTANEFTITPV